jgi:hypothetical protein
VPSPKVSQFSRRTIEPKDRDPLGDIAQRVRRELLQMPATSSAGEPTG